MSGLQRGKPSPYSSSGPRWVAGSEGGCCGVAVVVVVDFLFCSVLRMATL